MASFGPACDSQQGRHGLGLICRTMTLPPFDLSAVKKLLRVVRSCLNRLFIDLFLRLWLCWQDPYHSQIMLAR
jgi:hypothetical protein